MKRVLPCLAAPFFLGIFPVAAQTPSSINPDQLRQQVEALLESRAQSKATARAGAIHEIQQRAKTGNGAVDFFEDAYARVTFAGRPSAGQAKMDWAKTNADMLKSPEFKAAAQLHLQYLALTLERAGSKEPLDFVAPSLAYIQAYANADSSLFSKQGRMPDPQAKLLRDALRDSLIVRAFELQAMVRDLPDWEAVPNNLDGIFDKNILGPLRAAKDPRLLEAWRTRMEMGNKLATAQKLDSKRDEFTNQTYPSWRFARAEDLIVIGRQNEGINEMVALLQNYPNHPAFEKWGQRVLEILSPAPATPPPAAPAP